ncbi:MAG: hypothetical protein ABW215_13825 [Kibdelosporangium sp.]
MPHSQPRLADLRRTAVVFNGFANVDRTWLRLIEDTRPAIDLTLADHRTVLLRWLNSWGCRIRYPRAGEPAPFDSGVLQWWRTWQPALPRTGIQELSDTDIKAVGDAYADLAAVVVSEGRTRRTLGPTAAAKALYALAPRAVMPWDAAIAVRLHGERDGVAFARHQELGRTWAAAIIAEAGGDENAVTQSIGRPSISLAKILDEYLYVTITMPGQDATRGEQ